MGRFPPASFAARAQDTHSSPFGRCNIFLKPGRPLPMKGRNMGWKLMRSAQHGELHAAAPDDLRRDDFDFICRLVYQRSGIHLGPDKRPLVVHRLLKRVRQLGLTGLSEYCRLLRRPGNEAELDTVLDLLTTNVTHFFREPAHFEFLSRVLSAEANTPRHHRRGPFTVWSAACSSGQEPYSIAIVLAEHEHQHPGFQWRVEATDISQRMLEKATQGIYRRAELQLRQIAWLSRYFQRGLGQWTGYYRVRPELRSRIRFQRWNLLQTPYPFDQPFEVIFCRNVMIYFDRATQQRVVHNLLGQLRAGGYLIVGHSESLIGLSARLRPIQPSIYRYEPM